MRLPHRMRERVGMSFFFVCLLCTIALCADPNDPLPKRLAEIRTLNRLGLRDGEELETQCLQLVPDYNTPSERGRIYATIAWVYCERGFGTSADRKTAIAKTMEYTRKATECPLDAVTTCEMYERMADAILANSRDGPAEKWPETRRTAIVACLRGLKFALDNKAPKELPKPPPRIVVPNIITPSVSSARAAHLRYEQQLAARRQYDRIEQLYRHRRTLTLQCASLYGQPPYDPGEFRIQAQRILLGYDEVVQELVECVNRQIESNSREIHATPDATQGRLER